MLVIYGKSDGYIYMMGNGYPTPTELGHMDVSIPEGQMLEKIDVSSGEAKPVFKDFPKSDYELLKEEIEVLKAQNQALIDGINSVTK